MSAVEKRPDYIVDSVDGGLRNLNDLISVICTVRYDLTENEDDTRIDSLLWIARDLVEGVVDCHLRNVRKNAKGGAA